MRTGGWWQGCGSVAQGGTARAVCSLRGIEETRGAGDTPWGWAHSIGLGTCIAHNMS